MASGGFGYFLTAGSIGTWGSWSADIVSRQGRYITIRFGYTLTSNGTTAYGYGRESDGGDHFVGGGSPWPYNHVDGYSISGSFDVRVDVGYAAGVHSGSTCIYTVYDGIYGWSDTAYYSLSYAATYTDPQDPASCSVSRASDSKNTVSWESGSTEQGLYASMEVGRSIDDGAWSVIDSISGAATSYVDGSTQADHGYAYRVRALGANGSYSGYATSGTTYNTPAAPTSIVATRAASTTVDLAITNPANTATATEIQRSTDGSTWTTVQTTSGKATEATDTPGGGTFYYRARNTRGGLSSAWSPTSNAVVTICAPAAPTLLTPASGVVVPMTQETVIFAWRHNPIDGSAQTKAQLSYSIDGGTTWSSAQVNDSTQHYDMQNPAEVNDTVTWRVRTKGAHDDYGPWSAVSTFRVYQVPTLVVTSPAADGTVITDVPIAVAWTYGDPSGTQQRAVVSVLDAQGAVLLSKTVQGGATAYAIATSDILLDNGASYTLTVSALSTSSLSASAVRAFATDYLEPGVPSMQHVIDEDTASVSMVIYSSSPDGAAATSSLGLFRQERDGSLTSLADAVPSGTGIIDRIPPIDRSVTYKVVAYTQNGLTSVLDVPLTIPSGGRLWWNFGADLMQVASLAMDISYGHTTDRAKQVFSDLAERELPVVRYGSMLTVTLDATGNRWWNDGWDDFEALERAEGAVYRRPRQDVIWVDCSVTRSDSADPLIGTSLTMQQISPPSISVDRSVA